MHLIKAFSFPSRYYSTLYSVATMRIDNNTTMIPQLYVVEHVVKRVTAYLNVLQIVYPESSRKQSKNANVKIKDLLNPTPQDTLVVNPILALTPTTHHPRPPPNQLELSRRY